MCGSFLFDAVSEAGPAAGQHCRLLLGRNPTCVQELPVRRRDVQAKRTAAAARLALEIPLAVRPRPHFGPAVSPQEFPYGPVVVPSEGLAVRLLARAVRLGDAPGATGKVTEPGEVLI